MSFLASDERTLAEEIAALAFANPFLEERLRHERRIDGEAETPDQPYWSLLPDAKHRARVQRIGARSAALVEALYERAQTGRRPAEDEQLLIDEVVIYFLYDRYEPHFLGQIEKPSGTVAFYDDFRADVVRYLSHHAVERADPAHLFACFYQVRRAFHHVYRNIVGRSIPAARLRGQVWESIFTHDMRRYRRGLYARMADVPTLITGPTGTGKELVARAIGLSRYIPFDERRARFAGDPQGTFVSVNLSALSPTLLESELFGHRKGAFTGALSDREGYLESCGPLGTVFLDEIGEVDPAVQVKLLRVLQSRTFQRTGDTVPRRFEGKIIAATNRDLGAEIRQGRFREDFYYRLCADTVTAPALAQQLDASPDELGHLVRFIAARVAGDGEADDLAADVLRAIAVSPGAGYRWPGNFRELEQCVRSVMLRGSYHATATGSSDPRQKVADGLLAGAFTADELLTRYCTLLYATMRNYSHVAERLGVDRRTVRAKIDPELLAALGR